jgi:glycerol-3-phosphate dehydrogenase (NAD(P)+)
LANSIIGIIGSGSWGTALAKILTDNGHHIHWTVRNEKIIKHLKLRHHNPQYLTTAKFDSQRLSLNTDPLETFTVADIILIAVPSAYVIQTVEEVSPALLRSKKIISAVKGILPQTNQLFNDYLKITVDFPIEQYFTIMGPCHAEEIAAEKLSYLTISGIGETDTQDIANLFQGNYVNTVVNHDIYGVQYAAILKNIYAMGAGIAHGLDYGDNFLSVLIANCADEMAEFLRKAGILNVEVGVHSKKALAKSKKSPNYAASVYLGDLLVTCYSLFSRNRTFGNMIGKGYSVKAAQLEMNMVAEGYNASKSAYILTQECGAEMPIATAIYQILWENLPSEAGFKIIEEHLI